MTCPGDTLLAAVALLVAVGCGTDEPSPRAGSGEPTRELADRPAEQGSAPLVRDVDDPRVDEGLKQLARNDFDAARALGQAVLDEHPGHGRAELLIGLGYHRQKHYALALPHLERAALRGPTFPKQSAAWYYLGWCRYWLGELEPARAAFEQHLALDPSEGDSHFGLGLIELELGHARNAEERFRQAATLLQARLDAGDDSLRSEVAKCHARLGDVYLLEERWAEARDELQRCVALWPPHYAAWYKLYRAHAELGEDDYAAAALAQHQRWKREVTGADE